MPQSYGLYKVPEKTLFFSQPFGWVEFYSLIATIFEKLKNTKCNKNNEWYSGLVYDLTKAAQPTANAVEEWLLDNNLAAYWLSVCQDFKHFGFAVSVLILNNEGTQIVRLLRKEACYCRFAVANDKVRLTLSK